MKIQVWNAFASNNSGSYTIVGSFGSDEVATAVAAELREVLDAHQRWFEATERPAESPLDEWCTREAIACTEPPGRDDDWPDYGSPPTIGAIGSQVVLHVPYTVAMAPVFGEYFYRRSGRVDVELNHAHAPLVWFHEIWWPWKDRDEGKVAASRVALLEEALGVGGPLFEDVDADDSPSWRSGDHFIEADLMIATVWTDPVAGASRLHALVLRHGAAMSSRVIEAFDRSDPVSMLRPCRPRVSAGLRDLVLLEPGDARQAVKNCLSRELFGTAGTHAHAVAMVEQAPTTVLRGKPAVLVVALGEKLAAIGAVVEIRDA
ncbi:MAG: hypothetical protein IAG13_16025 [Deltaproteobacteria bacterium]|nr:hypothetical protein [Nannocystaceae bacterium]